VREIILVLFVGEIIVVFLLIIKEMFTVLFVRGIMRFMGIKFLVDIVGVDVLIK